MFDYESVAYKAWKRIGKMIQEDKENKPRGLVVVSAHWENESGGNSVRGEPMAMEQLVGRNG